ncbi:hypothetical protein MWN33_14375 [Starkeya koreensis]|uniref:SlyX protein n=1 Tax=Ancylobacter koreensis TaxID=266121 RepID=A0ABT0DPK9_9HYPH|nr:hypothetical protein [Ancylobacter koreensis]MCK0209218.1 hypothetical protein [Ancylobacter koreensis]
MSEPDDEIVAELTAMMHDIQAGFMSLEHRFDASEARLDGLAQKLDAALAEAKKRHNTF